MAPKPSVQLLLTSPSLLAPGDHVTGTLVIDIFEKPYELTGVYVELIGKEYSFVVVQSGQYTYVVPFYFNHVELHRTLYGATKESGKRGGARLEPGHYEYPFDFELPLDAPPTYVAAVPSGGSQVMYKVRGVLSVPHRRSTRVKVPVVVVPVISFEQSQQAHGEALDIAAVDVPLMKHLGMCKSKTQFVTLALQTWPTATALGGRMAQLYYEGQRQVAEGGGALVMGKSLDAQDDSSSDDEGAAKQHKLAKKVKKLEDDDDDDDGDDDAANKENGVNALHATETGPVDPDPSEALPGKVVRLYEHEEDKHVPFKASTDAPGVVCARVILKNCTKNEKIKKFEVCLRQIRRVVIGAYGAQDVVSLSKAVVEMPDGRPCGPGSRVAVDVELPIRRALMYGKNPFTKKLPSYKNLRRQPCPTLATHVFTCETEMQLKFPKNRMNKKNCCFHDCLQITEVVGAPGVPHVEIPVSFTTKHELPELELKADEIVEAEDVHDEVVAVK